MSYTMAMPPPNHERATLIKESREKLGLKPEKLAKLVGVSRITILNWEKGMQPKSDHLQKLSRALRLTMGQLQGEEEKTLGISQKNGIEDWVKSGNIPKFSKSNEITEWLCNHALPAQYTVVNMPAIKEKYSEDLFAFEVVGSAMVNRNNPQESIFPGETAYIDRKIIYSDGDLVLVEFGPDDLRVRQYREDGAHKSLHAFGPNIDPVTITAEIKIIGPIVESSRTWKKK
jgi:transcriptional regulator with XRE-family HTH domain